MRQGGGRYNRGVYIERSEYPRGQSVWGIAAKNNVRLRILIIFSTHIRNHQLYGWFSSILDARRNFSLQLLT